MSARATMTIVIPADTRFFRPVRLAVGAMAAAAGFDVEAIEDLRIGVDEVCGSLAEAGDGSELRLEIHDEGSGVVRVEGASLAGGLGLDDDRFRFSRQILSVVSDTYGFERDGAQVRFWLERSRSGSPEAGADDPIPR